MDATIHYASNGDSDADASYLRNLPIIKLLQKATIDVDDWSVLLSAAPNGEDKLHGSLGCGADSPRLSVVTSAMCDTI